MKQFFVYLSSQWYELKEQAKVRKLFYSDTKFAEVDRAVQFLPNPYRIPKAFPYGETPLRTYLEIAHRFGLAASDRVVELGCGRGRGVFFLSHHFRCYARGVDWADEFVSGAKRIAAKMQVPNVDFVCEDMCAADMSDATFIYLYGTCLEDDTLEKLKFPKGAKVVTVSFPLFEVIDQFEVSFPWGKTDVYLQKT